MQETNADLLFPPWVIPSLGYLRGPAWQTLIERITNLGSLEEERLAFILMMVYLGGCVTCQADSFKAMRGCKQCSLLTIKRFRGSDQDLVKKYSEALHEIIKYLHED